MQTVERLDDLPASEWDRLFDADQHPCVSHAFLSTLETTGCVGQDTGWQPRHQIVRDSQGKLVAAAPDDKGSYGLNVPFLEVVVTDSLGVSSGFTIGKSPSKRAFTNSFSNDPSF